MGVTCEVFTEIQLGIFYLCLELWRHTEPAETSLASQQNVQRLLRAFAFVGSQLGSSVLPPFCKMICSVSDLRVTVTLLKQNA